MEGGRSTDDQSTTPVTACRRCRRKKLRCSHELPTCKRCKDIPAVCEYPPPPNRKLLAALRVQNAKARRESESSRSQCQGLLRQPAMYETATSRDTGLSSLSDKLRSPTPPSQASLQRATLPSSEVAISLIEIYFSHLYNANLIFHKRTFLSEYAMNRIPGFLALSVFALASIFLCPSHREFSKEASQDGIDFGMSMLSGADFTKQGLEWATAASQQALMQSDVSRIETVQACQNLGLYWFSRGHGDRAHIHTAVAYKTAKLLHLHVQRNGEDRLADEVKSRVFWACWITSCISQDNANFKAQPWKETAGLFFPADEDSYKAGNPRALEYFDEGGSVTTNGSPVTRQPSIMAEHVKLFNIWWEVQHFVKMHSSSPSDDSPEKLAPLLELDCRLSLVFESMHPDLQYMNASTFSSAKLDPYLLFQLHCLYRLCACALHSSIVPLFSSALSNPNVNRNFVRMSAEEAVKHSAITLDMAAAFLSTDPDISCLPSLTGFVMFIASVIYFKSLAVQRKLHGSAMDTGRLKAAVGIIQRLKEYWVPLNGLWDQLQTIFATEGLSIGAISLSRCYLRPGLDEQAIDYEQIVSADHATVSGWADLYTYVANQEKNTSPRRYSSSQGISKPKNTQNAPSSLSMPGAQLDGQTNMSPMSQRRALRQQPLSQAYPVLPNQIPLPPTPQTSQSYSLSLNQSMARPQQEGGYIQDLTVAGEIPSHLPSQHFGPIVGYGNVNSIGLDVEVDIAMQVSGVGFVGCNWWEQEFWV